jgi:hypothetical protein
MRKWEGLTLVYPVVETDGPFMEIMEQLFIRLIEGVKSDFTNDEDFANIGYSFHRECVSLHIVARGGSVFEKIERHTRKAIETLGLPKDVTVSGLPFSKRRAEYKSILSCILREYGKELGYTPSSPLGRYTIRESAYGEGHVTS